MTFVVRCPACRAKLVWTSARPIPATCPLCDAQVASVRPDDEICLPAIRTQATKNNDKLYRDMESGSEARAQIAANQLGVPVSEMSDMKITNLNDRRDSEVAAMATRVAEAHANGVVGGFPAPAAQQPSPNQTYGPGIRTGAVVANGQVVGNNVAPMAGARAHATIKRMHGS